MSVSQPSAKAWLFHQGHWVAIDDPGIYQRFDYQDGSSKFHHDWDAMGYMGEPVYLGALTQPPWGCIGIYEPSIYADQPQPPYPYVVELALLIHDQHIYVADLPSLIELLQKLAPLVVANLLTEQREEDRLDWKMA